MTYKEAKEILDNLDKKPYPKLEYISKNTIYAKTLYDDFAGKNGELSAITQYIYEHINNKSNKDISKIMLDVAIVEMRHLSMVGDLIQKLGLNAKYIDSNLEAWNSNSVSYITGNIKEIMLYNINAEREAIKGYKKAIMRTRNIYIQKFFNRIILDEKSHIEIFTRIMNEN